MADRQIPPLHIRPDEVKFCAILRNIAKKWHKNSVKRALAHFKTAVNPPYTHQQKTFAEFRLNPARMACFISAVGKSR
jgi:hypothetical protein